MTFQAQLLPHPDRPSFTGLGKGIVSRPKERVFAEDSAVQDGKWGLSPCVGQAFPPVDAALGGGGAQPHVQPPQKAAGTQTYVDVPRPHKGVTRDIGGVGVERGSTALPNTGKDLHATWTGTRVGIEGLGAPGGPTWSPIRKKHLQTLPG